MKIEIGSRIYYESAAGAIVGVVKNIVLDKNAAGETIPWMIIHALSGERQAPKFRNGTVRALRMKDRGANVSGKSCPQRIPEYDVSGSSYIGCLPAPQGNPPLSTIIPPRHAPCPPTHLVNDETTMSHPCSNGLQR